MKELEKMSLATIAGKLTRKEMKNIMAGSGSGGRPDYVQCCQTNSNVCGTCVFKGGGGIPTCSPGYELKNC